jgi:tRNA G18 (ribose-2'-O)-methylase SpoU
MEQVVYGINPVIEALRAREVRVREVLIAQNRKKHLDGTTSGSVMGRGKT